MTKYRTKGSFKFKELFDFLVLHTNYTKQLSKLDFQKFISKVIQT